MIERIEQARRYCRQHGIAIDVGAHRGWYTIEMAKHFGYVFAFEPTTKNFNELIGNIWNTHNVNAYRLGVSDKNGEAVFDIGGKPQGFKIAGPAGCAIGETCKLISLDSFFDQFASIKIPDFIKIDVEGHEALVLRGAEKMIRTHRPVLMIEEKFDPIFAASQLLEQWGYSQVWKKKHDRIFTCKSS